jgi:hypothetical protein
LRLTRRLRDELLDPKRLITHHFRRDHILHWGLIYLNATRVDSAPSAVEISPENFDARYGRDDE